MEVRTCLYTRAAVEKLGIAPLTSMFLYGENSQRPADDLRPEVHDSDGMLLATGRGEWIWRPLTNRSTLQISSFGDENPRGFGLMQRSEEHTSELQSLMRISYAVFCLKKKKIHNHQTNNQQYDTHHDLK